MEKTVSITYMPEKEKIQVLVQFEYNGADQYSIVLMNSSDLPSDFTKIEDSFNFINAKNEAITKKIIEINTPIPTI